MKKLMAIRIVLLVAISLSIGLASASVTHGQAGRVDVPPPPPPRPMPSPTALDLGTIDGTKYNNNQLGFSFSAPATWIVRDANELMAMRETARKVFEDEKDPRKKAAIEASIERTTSLFAASKLKINEGGLNAFLACIAERIPSAVITTPLEYFNLMMKTMNGSEQMKVEVLEPFKLVKIGTGDFGTYTIKITTEGGAIVQKQLMAVNGLYAYGLAYSYVDNEDAATFDEVVKTVKSK